MPPDRSKYVECLKHFVEELLGEQMTDDIARALAESGCKDIETLAMLQTVDVGRLTLRDPTTGVEEPLGVTHKRVLKIALLFFCEDKADVYDYTLSLIHI